jgi:hypothetical protein
MWKRRFIHEIFSEETERGLRLFQVSCRRAAVSGFRALSAGFRASPVSSFKFNGQTF